MNAADRVRVAATATSDTAYTLGAAEDGFLDFWTGFDMPTAAESADSWSLYNVPLLVERAAGGWQIITANIVRQVGDYAELQGVVFRQSSTGSALGLTGGEAVTITVIPSALSMQMVAFALPQYADSAERGGWRPDVTQGLMALGKGCTAGSPYATSQGCGAYTNTPYEAVIGAAPWAAAGGGAALATRGIKAAVTTDATPTKLGIHDKDGAVAFAGDYFVDSGITTMRGTLSAIDHASGDTKVWDVLFAVRTSLDYATTALLGVVSKTVVQESAGATAWDVDVVADSGSNSFSIQVTGDAATTISWVFDYAGHNHIAYL